MVASRRRYAMASHADSAAGSSSPTARRRICLIADSFALAKLLAAHGMHVTVSVPLQKESSLPKLHRSPQLPNIDLPNIDLPNIDLVEIPALRQTATPCQYFRDSYSVYLWLREQQFDVICFPMRGGIGFHSLVAQAQGLAFPRTLLCVVAETPSLRNRLAKHELLSGLAPLRLDFMERRSVELADLLFASDQTLLDGLCKEGYSLPSQRVLCPPISQSVSDDNRALWTDSFSHTPLPNRVLAEAQLAVRSDLPLVSVCLVHFNRPHFLRQALDSVRTQDYPHFEVILVDDGSTDQHALSLLQSLEPEFAERGWKIIRQQNRYLGAARNTAANMARGKYLLFMDDDNVAKPHELRTFVAVAEYGGADILTCHVERFSSSQSPLSSRSGSTPTEEWGPLGAALAVGLCDNVFGDANALFRRSVFIQLGGFTEQYGVGHEDWELFAKACLAGFRLEVIAAPLFYYRVQPGSMLSSSKRNANLLRSATPYLEGAPPWLQQILLGYQGQYFALYQPSGGQPVLTEAPALSDEELLRMKNRVYDALRPYPRALNVLRRSAQSLLRLTRRS
jgi:GT2 family glycosyltransferase